MGTSDTKRRVMNWGLIGCLVLLYISQGISKGVHVFLGVAFLVLLTLHITKYAKWFKASTKAFFSKKLKGKNRTKYLIICVSGIAFAAACIVGFVSAYELITIGEVGERTHRIHNAFAIISGLFTIFHLAPQISKRRKSSLHQKVNSQG